MSSSPWDSKTFRLQDHYPRSSTANQVIPFRRQPLRFLFQVYFVTTFPIRLFLILLPKAIYQLLLDKNAPPSHRLIDLLSILIARSLIDDFYIPSGGGPRGTHLSAPLSDATQLKLLKSTKGLPEIIHPKMQVNQLRQPVKSWAEDAGVKQANDLTLWWLGRRSEQGKQRRAKRGEKVMLYLSGGGYLIGTCYPNHDFASIPGTILKQIQSYCQRSPAAVEKLPQSMVSVEYRRTELAPTPGALIDALCSYRHLVDDLGFEARNISVSGDSAGGHLVNCLVRYLVEGGEAIPSKIVLISPWGDQAGTTIEHNTSSYKRMLPYDILSDRFYHYCRDFYAARLHNPAEALLDVYFSPTALLGFVKNRKIINNTSSSSSTTITKQTEKDIFKGWPSTLILCGKYEVLKDQSVEMFRRVKLSKEAEKKIQDSEASFFMIDTCHDPFVAPFFVFPKQRKEGMQRIVSWLAL